MKARFHMYLALIIFFSLFADHQSLAASESIQANSDSPSPKAVCMPGIYTSTPDDCILAGPAAYLTKMAASGLTFH